MNRNTIRLVVVWGSISIIGIITIQIYWVQRAFDLKEKQFNQTIHIALQNVANKILAYNNTTLPVYDAVSQQSSNYFIVNVNDVIDANVLEHYLETELEQKDISLDFEYAIYDCTSDKMVYGNYVSATEDQKGYTRNINLPKMDEYVYYFGVLFPTKTSFLVNSMGIWVFFSLILLFAIVFFSYSVFVILKQKRLSEVQKDFINNMTHEFKTPISTIAISANVLAQPDIVENPQRLLNYSTIIQEENARLQNQVEKVLQMVSIERREFHLKKEKLDLHEQMERVVKNMEPVIQDKNAHVHLELKAANAQVIADKFHLTNIIYNLLDNALKYGGISPEVRVRTFNDKGKLLIEIKDHGPGIPKTFHRKIFDKFFRIPTGNIHDVKGFGLGLSYVKNIVKAHKWKIYLESREGEGTSFILIMGKNQ